ncbi:MAG: UDP-N-acetylmuramoyl-L-alanine--D-glutamate ligase [Balneolales bacterium]|nr:UDP-N-acetylmuramoyl-L-alanine--D-glutamate ligase [Balneolales bacterium]
MKKVKDLNIVVVGGARSGAAVAVLLENAGAKVFVTDSNAIGGFQKEVLATNDIAFEENGHSLRARQAEMVVVSPGVPDEAPIIQYFLNNDIPVNSEIEIASWFCKSPIVAITGSNGKTTTTSWLQHIWKTADKPALVAGNIGRAVSEVVLDTSPEKDLILEVSSFQLDHISRFRPKTATILNITPDHLNRYQNRFDFYAASKMRIIKNQQPDDFFVYNFDDPVLKSQIIKANIKEDGPARIPFSITEQLSSGAFVRKGEIIIRLNDTELSLMPVEKLSLKGNHNLGNALAASLMAVLHGVSAEALSTGLETFEGVEHRLEQVRILNGVRYVNDSKATNVNAVWFALQSFKSPVVLIIGGQDKGNNYKELTDQIRQKVHTVIAIGEAKEAIRSQISRDALYYYEAESMEEAVQTAKKQARKGEVVLLSPACASFDMFKNFEHRGEVFKQAVAKLKA